MMSSNKAKQFIGELLQSCDVTIDGDRPSDIQVHNEMLYPRLLRQTSLGLGESYMEGWWDCDQLDEFFFKLLYQLNSRDIYRPSMFLRFLVANLFSNQQTKGRSTRVAKVHYDLDNDLYRHMLGETMAYTCAYWREANTLDEAQKAKFDLVCRKLELQPGEKVLELGCGWGGFAKYAAENYGVELVSVNISEQQMNYAKKICQDLPIQLFTTDYRDVSAYNPKHMKFDKVVSIGMCEHVGHKNYAAFIALVREQLKDDGLFLLHTIGKNRSVMFGDPWLRKYIFPNGMLPTLKWLSAAFEGQFVVEDLHSFGADYDRTLMEWDRQFVSSWPELQSRYDERFYRMWRYYLMCCAGGFRARRIQLWQFLLSPKGKLHGYTSIR